MIYVNLIYFIFMLNIFVFWFFGINVDFLNNLGFGDIRGDRMFMLLLMVGLLLFFVELNLCRRVDVILLIVVFKLFVLILLFMVELGKLLVKCLFEIKVFLSLKLWLLIWFLGVKEDLRILELREFLVKWLFKVNFKGGVMWLVLWNEFKKLEGVIGLFLKLFVWVSLWIFVLLKLVLKIYIEI